MKRLYLLVLLFLLTEFSIVPLTSTAQKPTQQVMLSQKISAASSDFATDTFTQGGGSNINLEDHTGELATWISHPHINYNGSNLTLDVTNDNVFAIGTDVLYVNQSPPSANYSVQLDITHTTLTSVNIGPAGRIDTTNDTMYTCRSNSGTSYDLRKLVATVGTTMQTTTTNLPTTGQTKTLKLIMSGDQISCSVDGVVLLGPVTDTSITAAGKAGIRGAGASTSTTGFRVDNFHAQ